MSDNARMEALEKEMAALKKQLPQRTQGKAPDDIPLAKCNEIAARAALEIRAEKQDAATIAKAAIDAAFGDRKRTSQVRVQKPVAAPVAPEVAKKLTQAKAST